MGDYDDFFGKPANRFVRWVAWRRLMIESPINDKLRFNDKWRDKGWREYVRRYFCDAEGRYNVTVHPVWGKRVKRSQMASTWVHIFHQRPETRRRKLLKHSRLLYNYFYRRMKRAQQEDEREMYGDDPDFKHMFFDPGMRDWWKETVGRAKAEKRAARKEARKAK